ncbi:unnamed protein product, partial [Prorocentrum cordatum]
VAFVQNRFQYRRNGRTAYEDLKMVKYRSPLLIFAENIPAKKSGVPDNRLTSAWQAGVWLRRSTATGEHIAGTMLGIVKARAVKKRPEELQWDKEAFDKMVFPMWSQTDLKDVRGTAGWTPTEGPSSRGYGLVEQWWHYQLNQQQQRRQLQDRGRDQRLQVLSAKQLIEKTEDVEMSIQVVEQLKPNEEENDEQMNKRVIMTRKFTEQEITIARY